MSLSIVENPTIPGVYAITSLRASTGVLLAAHEPNVYAYYDGVDTWSTWHFSVKEAYKAKPAPGAQYLWSGDALRMPHHTNSLPQLRIREKILLEGVAKRDAEASIDLASEVAVERPRST